MLLAGFVWLWWQGVPALYRSTPDVSPADRLKAVTDTRTALLAGLAAAGALGTFWLNSRAQRFTAQSLRLTEQTFRLAERSQEQTFRLTERGHLTDRYSKAIEQLGSDKLDVRLGGIYALEQLATDSEKSRDQVTIVAVLGAFVRVHSDPLYQYKASLPETVALAASAESVEDQRRWAAQYVADLDRPPVDVQAAVTVLGRLPPREGVGRGDLAGANLTKVDLHQANLAEANLQRANLTKATLGGANLAGVDLSDADLTGASLDRANLTYASLGCADLTGADLVGADLTGSTLIRANLTKVNLDRASLTDAILAEADLTCANLDCTDLDGAYLAGANLTEATCLFQVQVDGAAGNVLTRLPEHLHRPDGWLRR